MTDIVSQDFEMMQDEESIKISDNRAININDSHIQLGVIKSYDHQKRTAKIQPLIGMTNGDNEYDDLPLLTNVPILHLGTDSYIIHMPIKENDVVILFVCDRDISALDKTDKRNVPTYSESNRMFSMSDAVAIPITFRQYGVQVSNNNAITIESIDASTKIELVNGAITLTSSNVNINGNVSINGDLSLNGTFTNNGVNMTNHTHGGVSSGGESTQGPQ
ncbi:MAG: phage baseplate assembly protein V [Chitinophagia bacterium]|nr:phage baseplate assembly protein V [Chitinophagia bacterium]